MTPIDDCRQGATKIEPVVPVLPLSRRESMLIIISFSTANLSSWGFVLQMRCFSHTTVAGCWGLNRLEENMMMCESPWIQWWSGGKCPNVSHQTLGIYFISDTAESDVKEIPKMGHWPNPDSWGLNMMYTWILARWFWKKDEKRVKSDAECLYVLKPYWQVKQLKKRFSNWVVSSLMRQFGKMINDDRIETF